MNQQQSLVWTDKEVADQLRISVRTLYRTRDSVSDFPRPLAILGLNRWHSGDIKEWITQNRPELLADEVPLVALCPEPVSGRSGVYMLFKGNALIYIGQSINVDVRISQHRSDGKDFDGMQYVPCSKERLRALEARYIRAYNPALNFQMKVAA